MIRIHKSYDIKSAAKATEEYGRYGDDQLWALGCTVLISEVAANGFGWELSGLYSAATVSPSQDSSEKPWTVHRATGVSNSHLGDLRWLISMVNMTRSGSWGTQLGVSVKAFLEMITGGGKGCGALPWVWINRNCKKENHVSSSTHLSHFPVYLDVSRQPHAPVAIPSLLWWTVCCQFISQK